ncbi:MAG: winged helix-turn-helix domain-containing protein [Nanoarchaeota archaeon]
MAERRNKIETIVDILEVIRNKGKLKTTHILYKSNLSHKKLKVLLEELMEKKMIKEHIEKNTHYYTITEEGLKFLNEYSKMKKFTDSFGF